MSGEKKPMSKVKLVFSIIGLIVCVVVYILLTKEENKLDKEIKQDLQSLRQMSK